MSEPTTIPSSPSRSEDDATPTAEEAPPATVTYEQPRRRRRRRRRKQGVAETPMQRLHLVLLVIVLACLLLAIVGPDVPRHAFEMLRHRIPRISGDISKWMEIIALGIAAVILIYLTPGVEERILTTLGIKRDRRRR